MQRPCPDPSAHQTGHKLSEQASTAALYATHPDRENPLNSEGKLSARSAAASLKYARPQDLPSFPSHGIDTANSASHAAMLAKDYKMKELWQPGMSEAGSKAALLAHKDGGKLNLWQPSASADGNSAAKLAMRNKTLSPQIDYGYTKDGRSNALLAATKSQRAGRQRAGSTPVAPAAAYPDSANSAHNALNAATISHRASTKAHNPRDPDGWDSAAMQAARIQNIGDHMDREMFTERPPVEIEKQEKRDQAALRASAISMAKQMYEVQNRTTLGDASSTPPLDGKAFANRVAQPVDIKQEALKYIHLQDAAHKLAQERLAKVDKNFEAIRYREYYGYGNQPKSRLSTRSFNRKRASSETAKDDLSSDDEDGAYRVRSQMSQFNTALASVDAKKQQTDRDNLLAIAQKRVQRSMQDMDEKVFQDTGKVSQAMMDDWEAKARKRASEDAEKREVTRGKTHLGGGKYMDTSEIEAIAQARLQPTFDEINDNAEKRRARDEDIRLDRAEQERQRQSEKQMEKEVKDIEKRNKLEHKAAVKEEKSIAKREKEERKAAEKEEKAAEAETAAAEHPHRRSILGMLSLRHKDKDTKHISSDKTTTVEAEPLAAPATAAIVTSGTTPTQPKLSSTTDRSSTVPVAAVVTDSSPADVEADKQSKGVKNLFSKLRHKSSKHDTSDTTAVTASSSVADEQSKSSKAIATPVVASSIAEPAALPQHMGTDGQIGDATRVSGINGNPEAETPSSFKRRGDGDKDDDADISSLSSSGLDEDDLREGRTGRMARTLGLGKLKSSKHAEPADKTVVSTSTTTTTTTAGAGAASAGAASATAAEDDDDDEDTFVEARDQPPTPMETLGGPKATAQSGRETKFQEVL